MAASFDSLAFGTMGPGASDGSDPASAAASVYDCTKHALATGFRHLDTAELYEATVPHVARAIADSGIARQSLFITSKLRGLPLGSEEQVATRVAHHIAQLGGNVGYLDLLLIHWPGKADIDPSANPDAQDISGACDFSWFSDNIGAAWANMLALRRSGLVRHIGVSNFYEPHLRALLHHIDAADVSQRPFANQIFLDVAHQQLDFVSYMEALDIRVIAYRPLAFLSTLSMLDDMGDTSASDAIAAASALFSAAALPLPTTHQLVLGALLARGIAVTTSSSNIEHIAATHQVKALVSTHHDLLSNVATLLQAIDNNETIEMCGAFDEFARACADAAATTAEACQ